MTSCLFNCLQAFLEDSSLAVNLLLTMPEISCESQDEAKFTIQASEMDPHDAPRKFVDSAFATASTFGHGLSFAGFGTTVLHTPSDRPGQ